jgi:hypothetical protein
LYRPLRSDSLVISTKLTLAIFLSLLSKIGGCKLIKPLIGEPAIGPGPPLSSCAPDL